MDRLFRGFRVAKTQRVIIEKVRIERRGTSGFGSLGRSGANDTQGSSYTEKNV